MGYYLGGMRGDYYRGRGDFWSKAKKKLKSAGRSIALASPQLTGGFSSTNQQLGAFMPGIGTIGAPSGGGGLISSLGGLLGEKFGLGAAAGATIASALAGSGGTQPGDSPYIPDILEIPLERAGLNEMRGKKRRTMNAANVHALRRALRRVDSFRNLAKKSGALPAARRLPPQRACAHK